MNVFHFKTSKLIKKKKKGKNPLHLTHLAKEPFKYIILGSFSSPNPQWFPISLKAKVKGLWDLHHLPSLSDIIAYLPLHLSSSATQTSCLRAFAPVVLCAYRVFTQNRSSRLSP